MVVVTVTGVGDEIGVEVAGDMDPYVPGLSSKRSEAVAQQAVLASIPFSQQ